MIARIIIGIIFIGVGFVFVWKTDIPYRLIGYVPFAERVFMGGSRMFYKLLGILLVVLGAIIIAGLQTSVLDATIGRLFLGR
jgi:hypothetical protein